MNFQEYIKPELLILIPVLYIVGMILKNTEKISDKYIPLILGVCGIFLSSIYVLSISSFSLTGIFTGITQGILTAGTAVYADQLVKQHKK